MYNMTHFVLSEPPEIHNEAMVVGENRRDRDFAARGRSSGIAMHGHYVGRCTQLKEEDSFRNL